MAILVLDGRLSRSSAALSKKSGNCPVPAKSGQVKGFVVDTSALTSRILFVCALVCAFLLVSCTQTSQTAVDTLVSAMNDLVNESVPLETARQEIDNAFQEWNSDIYRSAMESFIESGGDFFSLVERSKAIEPCVVEINSKTERYEKTSGIQVLYVNGIATDHAGASDDARALAAALEDCTNASDIDVALVYNPSGVTGIAGDLVEASAQALTDFVAKPIDFTNFNVFSTQLLSRILEALNANDRVIIVAFSQGNYYTASALSSELLTSSQRSRISVIQTGSPAGDWPSGLLSNHRIAIEGDPVALLSNAVEATIPYEGGANGWGTWLISLLTPVYPVFAPYAALESVLDRHNFRGAYLTGTALETLRNYVCGEGEGEGACAEDLAGWWVVTTGQVTYVDSTRPVLGVGDPVVICDLGCFYVEREGTFAVYVDPMGLNDIFLIKVTPDWMIEFIDDAFGYTMSAAYTQGELNLTFAGTGTANGITLGSISGDVTLTCQIPGYCGCSQ